MTIATTPGWPTVLLAHKLPDETSHVDWMIASEPSGREPLVTFRLARRVDEMAAGQRLLAHRIDDHRPAYLTYEGPVSVGRGTVERLTRGTVVSWQRTGDRWRMEVEWPDANGGLRRQDLRLGPREAQRDATCEGPSEDPGEAWSIEVAGPPERAGGC